MRPCLDAEEIPVFIRSVCVTEQRCPTQMTLIHGASGCLLKNRSKVKEAMWGFLQLLSLCLFSSLHLCAHAARTCTGEYSSPCLRVAAKAEPYILFSDSWGYMLFCVCLADSEEQTFCCLQQIYRLHREDTELWRLKVFAAESCAQAVAH